MDYTASANLVRSEIWSDQIKEILLDSLNGNKYVRWLSGFPDGDLFTIPSIGELPMRETAENTPVVYDAIDTGEFQFAIDRYVEAATFITDKAKQDAFYANQLIAGFVPKMRRALEENMESSVFALANSQTATTSNTINGAAHRMVASGDTNTTLALADFAKAKFALDKGNVSGSRIAIIDPSQEYVLNVLSNLVSVSNNPRFEGIVNTGFVNDVTGMSFIKNIYGFDVYVSNYLPAPTEAAGATINSVTVPTAPVSNIFMGFGGDVTPFVGAYRQMPNVEFERNKDLRRDEYVMNARFGLKLYRPESLVTIVSKSTI